MSLSPQRAIIALSSVSTLVWVPMGLILCCAFLGEHPGHHRAEGGAHTEHHQAASEGSRAEASGPVVAQAEAAGTGCVQPDLPPTRLAPKAGAPPRVERGGASLPERVAPAGLSGRGRTTLRRSRGPPDPKTPIYLRTRALLI